MIGPDPRFGVDVGPRARLGDMLVARGAITQEVLELALARQQEEGRRRLLGEILIEQGDVAPRTILETLAEAWGVPFVEQVSRIADPNLIDLMPREFLAEHRVLPLFRVREVVTVAVAEPANLFVLEEIGRLTGRPVQVAVADPEDIEQALRNYLPEAHVFVIEDIYDGVDEADFSLIERDVTEIGDLEEAAGHSPVVKLVNYILFSGVNEGASDIHIEPDDRRLRVRFRLDGRLFEKTSPPWQVHAALVSRIKIMAGLDIAERRVPQDGDIHLRIEGRPIDMRVSTMPAKFGEKVVVRIIDNRNAIVSLERIGFGPAMLEAWRSAVRRPNGVVLVTGPTGSGKSTTLYSVLASLDSNELNVSTVEDPIEAHIPGINQSQVNERAGFTFARALRALLRQDPDIIMVGEIRDEETAVIATQAALTGHMVFSTLHTNDAPSAVTRLVHVGIEPYLVAATLRAVLAQRLVRKICPMCRETYEPDPLTREIVENLAGPTETFHRGAGCARCRGTGFAGRIGIFELLDPDEELLSLVARGAGLHDLYEVLGRNGFVTLRSDGMAKVRAGTTTPEEVFHVTVT